MVSFLIVSSVKLLNCDGCAHLHGGKKHGKKAAGETKKHILFWRHMMYLRSWNWLGGRIYYTNFDGAAVLCAAVQSAVILYGGHFATLHYKSSIPHRSSKRKHRMLCPYSWGTHEGVIISLFRPLFNPTLSRLFTASNKKREPAVLLRYNTHMQAK